MKIRTSVIVLVCFFSSIAFLKYSEVDNNLTREDILYINKILRGDLESPSLETFEQEIEFITQIQDRIISYSKTEGISKFEKREPKNFFRQQKGLCYDRSRVIEKILRYYNFKTRHVSLYYYGKKNKYLALLTPRIDSHTVTEVLTKRGWLVVDSNIRWISLDQESQPFPIDKVVNQKGKRKTISWMDSGVKYQHTYGRPFIWIYGLYSRHGKFYPPYNFIPDINIKEFLYNFLNE